LIDGDPDTIWASFECFAPDAREEWIRIDLPAESLISQIKITCNKRYMNRNRGGPYRPQWHLGNALPKDISFKISRDAWHWDEVFSCMDADADSDEVTAELNEPARVKQILISGRNFTKIGYEGYMFSISGVEVISPGGRNLALVSNGAGVTVSSTSDAHNSDRHSANSLWGPLQYDIGNKWVKVGSDNGSSMWCFTEHEKGVLKIDEDFDAVITEAVKNGINVILTLDFKGNWIYENPPRKTNWLEARFKELNESYMCGISAADDSPEMFEGYFRYIEYMVGHFKDRVTIFEIGNEWDGGGWKHNEPDKVKWYKNAILKPTLDFIKRVAPDVKVALGGICGFNTEILLSCLEGGVAEKINGICWHSANTPNNEYYDSIRAFRRECEKLGFRGQYFVNEIYAGAAYPPGSVEGNIFRTTDIQEAKWYIKSMVGYACLNIESGPCHVHFTGFPHPQSVCRTTVPSQYIAPSQSKPSYYAIRNASTIMDDFYESDFPVEFSPDDDSYTVKFTLESGDKTRLMVAVFLDRPLSDEVTEKKMSLTVHAANIKSASVIDVLNGTTQELNIKSDGGKAIIENIFIKDYPLFIILTAKKHNEVI